MNMMWEHHDYKMDKYGKDQVMIWAWSHVYQAAAMCGKTCGQKLSDMGNYSELNR